MPPLSPSQTTHLINQLSSNRFPGIGPILAARIVGRYQEKALSTLQKNPYQLVRDITGIGFLTADRLAQTLGFKPNDPQRIQAGLEYTLQDALGSGHVYLPKTELLAKTQKILKVNCRFINKAYTQIVKEKRVIQEKGNIYLSGYYFYETGVAALIQKLAAVKPIKSAIKLEALKNELPRLLPFKLARGQSLAVETALSHPFTIITGGPGTGKSTTIQALCSLLKDKGLSVTLAAPTGRAARRLAEIVRHNAFTLHRLLKIRPGRKPLYNEQNPLLTDYLIVDEVSMLDLSLTYFTLAAIKPGTSLIWVGDADQLPSVGPGNVLRDVIASQVTPVVELVQIFRQKSHSVISVNAARIKQGSYPFLPKHPTDFYLFTEEKAESAADRILDLLTQRIPKKFGISPDNIQVLSPMYKSAAGVIALNQRLQEQLNPPKPDKAQIKVGSQLYRVGDKVMQTSNNYDKEVFNGELGQITKIDTQRKRATVQFDEREIVYKDLELDQITHSFVISIHKSQGGEFDAVVMPVLTSHYIMLERNLLYTAVTRAKKLCVLVGSRKALWIAIRNNQPQERYTNLKNRLVESKM